MPKNEAVCTDEEREESPALSPGEKVPLDDPSEYRPELKNMGKSKEEFRGFHEEDCERYSTVKKTYQLMHKCTQQTVESVRARIKNWCSFSHFKMTIMEALDKLDDLFDESDPDAINFPNSIHAYQTAERIREAHPDKRWFHLVGLIHDIGKVIALYGEPQWAVVGDTFPVGCAFSDKCVFPEFFSENPDSSHPVYSTKYGMYKPNCGLSNVLMSFGHDEYMYRVLVANGCKIPDEGLAMIRFHSFYPWHTEGAYDHLCNDKDREMLQWIRTFNQFDLYSKADVWPNVEEIKPYYQSLIDEYIPGVINF